MYEAREFIPIDFGEAIHRAMFIYLNAMQHGIKTVKMGLTDNEVIKEKIIGGFYHPAFGFLVKSEAFYRAVMAKLTQACFNGGVTVFLNNRDIPHLLGHKRSNMKRFHNAGIFITWQTTDFPSGTFVLVSGEKETAGTVFDALPVAWVGQ